MAAEAEYEEDDTINGYTPEIVRPPENPTEWFEAVVTELAWQTGRTLPLNGSESIGHALNALYNRGASPAEAADFFIEKMEMKRCDLSD